MVTVAEILKNNGFALTLDDNNGTADSAISVARMEAVEWMLKVNAHYGDKPWMIQLAAATCLSLAANVEETQVPLLLDLQVEDTKYVFEAKTIQRMELLVLSTLQWRMNPVTPLSFLDHIIRRLGLKTHVHWEFLRRCERLLLSVVADSRFVGYLPSVLAPATMLHVIHQIDPCNSTEYRNQLLGVLNLNREKVKDGYELIRELASNTSCCFNVKLNHLYYGSERACIKQLCAGISTFTSLCGQFCEKGGLHETIQVPIEKGVRGLEQKKPRLFTSSRRFPVTIPMNGPVHFLQTNFLSDLCLATIEVFFHLYMETEDLIDLPPSSNSGYKSENDNLHNSECEPSDADSHPINCELKEDKLNEEISRTSEVDVGNGDSQLFMSADIDRDLIGCSSILQASIKLNETISVAEDVKCFSSGIQSENGCVTGQDGSPISNRKRDETISGVKKARMIVDKQQPSVHVKYNSLTRDSKQELEELLQQWSKWHAQHCSSSHDSNEVLESGEETILLQWTSFWMDNQTRNQMSEEFIALDRKSVPLYGRGYSLEGK
ncbi:unnamed protein product [Camellia sinensis]